jgi:uncharacterized membrane protein YbhN (UPF0104 family)
MRRFIPTAFALVIAVAFSVAQWDVLRDIFSRLTSIHPLGYVPLATAGIFMVVARGAFLRSCSPGISLRNAITADQSALAAGYGIALGGGAVGTGLRIHMFTRWGLPPQPIGASIVTTAVAPSFTTWGLPIVTLLPLIISGDADSIKILVFGVAIALVLVSIIFWFFALRNEFVFSLVGRIGESLRVRVLRHLPERFPKMKSALEKTRPDFFSSDLRVSLLLLLRTRGLHIFGSSALTLVAAFLCLWTSATLFGTQNLSTYEMLVAFSLVRVLVAVSPIPGAAGIAELGLIALLEQCGVSMVEATGTTLL